MAPKWFDHLTTWAGRASGEGDGLASSGKKVEFSLSPIWGTGGVIRGRWTALLAPTHTSCLKNVPPLTCYNLDIHGLITIIFGRSFTEKIINKSDDALFSHLTYLVLQQKRKPRRQRTGVLCMQHSPIEWKIWFPCFPILPGSAEAQATSGGIVKHLLIAYFIGNISAKKISKSTHACQSYNKPNVGRFWDTV